MTVLLGILIFALFLCVGVIYDQHHTIIRQRKHLIEALDWIEPEAVVLPEDWNE